MKIYKIWSDKTKKIYIGKTTQKYLSQRLAVHKYQYKLYNKKKFNYISSFEIIKKGGNIKIELLKNAKSEKEEILKNKNCVNIHLY